MKRKWDLGLAVEDGEEGQIETTTANEHGMAEPAKRRSRPQLENANTDDPFFVQNPRDQSSLPTATPGRSILKPERSSHTTTPPSPFGQPIPMDSATSTDRFDAQSSSAPSAPSLEPITSPTSDDEDDITLQGVDRSIEHIEHIGRRAMVSLRERGDNYKQRLQKTQKQVSDFRLETAEDSHELRMMISVLKHKNGTAEEKIAQLIKAKDKAEDRWSVYKAQLKKAIKMSGELKDARNQIAYLETVLAFEERSGYSSMLSELQLE